jgi:hypothetical protein
MRWPRKKRNKYGATRVTIEGEKFDSKREARRWQQLLTLERLGKIMQLQRQPSYPIEIASRVVRYDSGRPMIYRADFRYLDADGILHVEDAKGVDTPASKIKRALVRAIYGVHVELV